MSLSAFLRDYLYVPLGGNRKGAFRRYVNLGLTMVLGGLWHGASWSFVLWGALHGAYLMVNHAFRAAVARIGWQPALDASRAFRFGAWALTFLCAVLAWVFFRAETLPGALRMLQAMADAGTAEPLPFLLLGNAGLAPSVGAIWCVALGAIAFLLPNTNVLGEGLRAALRQREPWRSLIGAMACFWAVLLVVVNTSRDAVSAFIYFNF